MAYTYQRRNYGDYYQGDIFGTIFGGIKKVAGVVSSALPGPAGAVARALIGGGSSRTTQVPAPAQPQINLPRVSVGGISTPAVSLALPSVTTPSAPYAMAPTGGGACGGPGYHRNKALARWERSVARGSGAQRPYVKNECVKNRSQNPLNPRALRRAIRRQQNMQHMMMRTLKGSGYKIVKVGRPGAKKTTRKR